MELVENVDLPVVDAEGQQTPQVVDIDDPNITPDKYSIELKTAAEASLEVPDAP